MPENINRNTNSESEQGPFQGIVEASIELGRSMGRMQAFLEASKVIFDSTEGICSLVSSPEEVVKVTTALANLSSKVASKT